MKELMSLLLPMSTVPPLRGHSEVSINQGRDIRNQCSRSSVDFQTLETHTVNIWLKALCFGVAFSLPAQTKAAAACTASRYGLCDVQSA